MKIENPFRIFYIKIMQKVFVDVGISVDGFIAGPNGDVKDS
ncbi:MAG TPA: hypothetical protein VH917_02770 [Ignavibacteriaceae bacterium]